MNWETLLCFGDSITFGARSYLGYPELCGDQLMKALDKDWQVINHSKNGMTTIDLLRSISPIVQQYQERFPSVITVMIGTNDVKTSVSPENFEIAYEQLIIQLKLIAVQRNIVCISIPKLQPKVFYPYTIEMNSLVDVFNQIILKLVEKHKLRTLELELVENDFYDGVHFSDSGNKSTADQLCKFLLKDKGIEHSTALP